MNETLPSIIGGIVGVIIGVAFVAIVNWAIFYFSRDQRLYREMRKFLKRNK